MLGKNTQFLTIFICKKSTIGDINNFFCKYKGFFKDLKNFFCKCKELFQKYKEFSKLYIYIFCLSIV